MTAAALPEVACTVWSNVVMDAGLRAGEVLLVHGGAGGIGTFAIQAAVALGARVAVTAGSAEKLARCRELGAEILVNYRDEDFVAVVREATGGHGADVVLDNMGAKYLGRNVDVLATNGRIQVIGMQGGTTGELDLGRLMSKRAQVRATTLRARPTEEKAEICERVAAEAWPLVGSGVIRPVVDRVLPMSDAAEAHRVVAEQRARRQGRPRGLRPRSGAVDVSPAGRPRGAAGAARPAPTCVSPVSRSDSTRAASFATCLTSAVPERVSVMRLRRRSSGSTSRVTSPRAAIASVIATTRAGSRRSTSATSRWDDGPSSRSVAR